ncbi:MAG: hypothetical protein ACFFB3_11505 [Candidatus Hodarchaeota archaeon]
MTSVKSVRQRLLIGHNKTSLGPIKTVLLKNLIGENVHGQTTCLLLLANR